MVGAADENYVSTPLEIRNDSEFERRVALESILGGEFRAGVKVDAAAYQG